MNYSRFDRIVDSDDEEDEEPDSAEAQAKERRRLLEKADIIPGPLKNALAKLKISLETNDEDGAEHCKREMGKMIRDLPEAERPAVMSAIQQVVMHTAQQQTAQQVMGTQQPFVAPEVKAHLATKGASTEDLAGGQQMHHLYKQQLAQLERAQQHLEGVDTDPEALASWLSSVGITPEEIAAAEAEGDPQAALRKLAARSVSSHLGKPLPAVPSAAKSASGARTVGGKRAAASEAELATKRAEIEARVQAAKKAQVASESTATAATATAATATAAMAERRAKAADQLRERGNAAMARADLPTARACYTEALAFADALTPEDRAKIHGNRSALYMSTDEPRLALADAEAAALLIPKSLKAHYRVGAAREACGDLDGAVAALRKAAALAPDSADMISRLEAAEAKAAAARNIVDEAPVVGHDARVGSRDQEVAGDEEATADGVGAAQAKKKKKKTAAQKREAAAKKEAEAEKARAEAEAERVRAAAEAKAAAEKEDAARAQAEKAAAKKAQAEKAAAAKAQAENVAAAKAQAEKAAKANAKAATVAVVPELDVSGVADTDSTVAASPEVEAAEEAAEEAIRKSIRLGLAQGDEKRIANAMQRHSSKASTATKAAAKAARAAIKKGTHAGITLEGLLQAEGGGAAVSPASRQGRPAGWGRAFALPDGATAEEKGVTVTKLSSLSTKGAVVLPDEAAGGTMQAVETAEAATETAEAEAERLEAEAVEAERLEAEAAVLAAAAQAEAEAKLAELQRVKAAKARAKKDLARAKKKDEQEKREEADAEAAILSKRAAAKGKTATPDSARGTAAPKAPPAPPPAKAAPPAPPVVDTSTLMAAKDAAASLFREAKFAEAAAAFGSLIAMCSTSSAGQEMVPRLLSNRAACHTELGDTRACMQDCDDALAALALPSALTDAPARMLKFKLTLRRAEARRRLSLMAGARSDLATLDAMATNDDERAAVSFLASQLGRK